MQKSFLIFGTRAVAEAIKAGKEIEKIFIQSGLSNELIRELTQAAHHRQTPFAYVPLAKLNRLTTGNHQGVVCLLSPISYASVEGIIDQTYQAGRDPLFVIVDQVTDVRNFGAIARTAECAGASAMIVADKGNAAITADAVKTSAGALHHLPVCRVKDMRETLRLLKDNGIQIIACTEKAEQTIFLENLSGPIALIVGSEEYGISSALLKQADRLVKIPMSGQIESLNVSVALGVGLYEIARQRGYK